MKLDILAFGAHPDDVELSCSGTILKHIKQGYKAGIVDLTQGELGSRGTIDTRYAEAAKASKILGISKRVNLKMADGFFEINHTNKIKIVEQLRRFKPDIVFCNAVSDRHPDHGRGSQLVSEACFLSALIQIETEFEGSKQDKWRPKAVYHYIQDRYIKPDFIVDITEEFDAKMASVLAYKTQFFDPNNKEENTPISSPEFLEHLKGRAAQFGRTINARYGEGFTVERTIGIEDVTILR